MGRRSRQVVCGERNGRMMLAPTHICTNYKKIRTKSKTLKCKKAGCQISAKQKKFDEQKFRRSPTKNAPIQGTFLYYFSVLNGASGMPVSLKIVTSQ